MSANGRQTVYQITFESTGEIWSRNLYATRESAQSACRFYNLTELVYTDNEGYWAYRNPSDTSQTATVKAVTVYP